MGEAVFFQRSEAVQPFFLASVSQKKEGVMNFNGVFFPYFKNNKNENDGT